MRLRMHLGEAEDDELAYAYYCANTPIDRIGIDPYDRKVCAKAYETRLLRLWQPRHLDRAVGMIAAAVEQQSATTSEINRNVSEVSHGADRIVASMQDIAGSTGETSRGADETERVAVALSAVANQVNAQIRRFTV